jgi:pimeloyl-ACP methyl ester carboxylesterase
VKITSSPPAEGSALVPGRGNRSGDSLPGSVARPFPAVPGVTHRFVTVRGARLHVAEAGSGDPVMLLHGFPQHWYAWQHVLPLLAGQYRLICPDWRGFGWSQTTPRGYDTASRAADILALIDALGLRQVPLIAHDWAGHAAFLTALDAPERVSHLLAVNAAHPWLTQRRLLPHRAASPAAWQPGEVEEFAAASRLPGSARAGEALNWQFVLHDIPGIILRRYRSMRLTVPTVILAGGQDWMLPPEMLAGADGHADDLQLRVVPGAGHFLPAERPAEVAAVACELFQRN